MQRIMIIGQPGSGKSSLARRLGERTGLPVVHVDRLQWQAGWVERSKSETTRLCLEAEQRERWIFEGGHSQTWPSRLERAELLVWLNRPVSLRMWRVVRRVMVGRGETRPDMAEDCPERLRSLPEFLHYIWVTRQSAVRKMEALAATARCPVVRLRSDEEVAAFVASFPPRC